MVKNNKITLKGTLFGFLLGTLVFGGMGVVAVTLNASQIKYTPSNSNFAATNAKEALDEIYKLTDSDIYLGNVTSGETFLKTMKDLYESAGYSLRLDNITTGSVMFGNIDFSNIKTITFGAKAIFSSTPVQNYLYDGTTVLYGIKSCSNTSSFDQNTINLVENGFDKVVSTMVFSNRGFFSVIDYETK